MGKEIRILSVCPCVTARVLLHAVKSSHLPALLPIREEGVLRIFITLKNTLLWPGLNLQPLGPVASTLTTTTPR
jgi:hypothetical protein